MESLTFQTKSPKTSRTTCGGKCFLDLNPWSNYEDITSTVVRQDLKTPKVSTDT